MRRDLVITTTIDSNYLNYFLVFSKSMETNSPDIPLHVRLVGEFSEDQIKSIESSNKNIIIQFDGEKLSKVRKNLRGMGEFLYGSSILDCISVKTNKFPRFLCSDQQCYTSNTRFRNPIYLLDLYESVIYMDADTIVRKNLRDIHNQLMDYDVCCNVSNCKRYPNERCWECSFMFFKRSKNCINFLHDVKELTESDMMNWDSDQISIEVTYTDKYKSVLSLNENIKSIEDVGPLHSRSFSEEAYIWAGSGKTKHMDKQFIEESKKYEDMLSDK